MAEDAAALAAEIEACVRCAADLPAGPRPIVRFSPTARILVIGQAPGSKVHATGKPWDDPSGDRLREWMGISREAFYDPAQVALMPMGFCYPGRASGGDAPPRRECAPLWHARILALLPPDRLTLLVGTYAQAAYLPPAKGRSMTTTVRAFRNFGPGLFPLPHPAWRSVLWIRRNPWFETEVRPALAEAVRAHLPAALR
jgi:uracil-DNA glycosylase